jgi:hypothetical protein
MTGLGWVELKREGKKKANGRHEMGLSKSHSHVLNLPV